MIYILKQIKRERSDTYEKGNGKCIDTGSNIMLMVVFSFYQEYIREKYVLCVAACAVAWCISIVLYIVSGITGGQNINFIAQFPEFVMIFPGMSMLATIIIPLQLKYGSEKGKIALFVICGCLAAVLVFAKNYLSELNGSIRSSSRVYSSR